MRDGWDYIEIDWIDGTEETEVEKKEYAAYFGSTSGQNRQMTRNRESMVKRLDAAGQQYAASKANGDEAAHQSALLEIFDLAYGLFPQFESVIGLFYEKRLNAYSPEKEKAFSKYMYWQLRYLMSDWNRKEHSQVRKTVIGEETGEKKREYIRTTIDIQGAAHNDEEKKQRVEERLRSADSERQISEIENDAVELFCLFTSSILTLPERLHGRANNPAKLNYFRMFYTADMTRLLREESAQLSVYAKHERDLFEAMKVPFLDYYMQHRCRTVFDISADELKNYSELVEGRPSVQTKCPLPGDVYLAYLMRKENKTISAAALSQQQKAYREYMKESAADYIES